jgi:ESF2/ABP1 family protein
MSSSSRGLKRPRAPVATDDDEEEDVAPVPSSASAAAVGAPDSAGGAADDAAAAIGGGAGSKRKYDGASELRPDRLQAFEDAELRKGVVYVGRVPPFMKPIKIRQLLEAYGEVGRVYLAPEGK